MPQPSRLKSGSSSAKKTSPPTPAKKVAAKKVAPTRSSAGRYLELGRLSGPESPGTGGTGVKARSKG